MKNIGRRGFLKTTAVTALGAMGACGDKGTGSVDEHDAGENNNEHFDAGGEDAVVEDADVIDPLIPKRLLGRTGFEASIVGLGGQSTLERNGTRDESVAIINHALDMGINYIDTAEAYGGGISESYIGEVMKDRRDEVFLATKIGQRTMESIENDRFEKSCERLQTDYIDLYFMHAVNSRNDLHTALNRDNGAIRAFENLKDQGRIGNIGISSHSCEILEEALDMYDLDCIFLTINPAGLTMNQNPKQTRDFLRQVAETDIGVIAMKLTARYNIFDRNITMEETITYALSAGYSGNNYPIATAVIGITTIDQIDDNVRIAKQYQPCDDSELDRLESIAMS